MLFLNNSKGKDATSLVEDIFIHDVLNAASCLPSLLSALRESNATTAHFFKTKSVALELLVAAEGLSVSVDTLTPDLTVALFKKHQVLGLLREAAQRETEVLLFDDVETLNKQILQPPSLQRIQKTKLVLVFDPNRKWTALTNLKHSKLIQDHFTINTLHFGFFSRLTHRGKLGTWMGRLDQSIIKHLIPARFKKGIYIELNHG